MTAFPVALLKLRFHKPGDVETILALHVGQLGN
jgi:hypothetical protein